MHSSLWRLGRFQTRAKFQKFVRRIRTPRRIVLTCLALVLLLIWAGQLVIGVMFREQADPERLRSWVPMGSGRLRAVAHPENIHRQAHRTI